MSDRGPTSQFSLYEQTQSWLTYFFFLLITHRAQDTLTTVRDPDHTNNQSDCSIISLCLGEIAKF